MKKNITALDILDDNKPITVGWTKYSGYLFYVNMDLIQNSILEKDGH